MRGVVVAMIGLGLAQPAFAADMGTLRGSFAPAATYRNWEGFYVGGDVGVGGGGANFDGNGSQLGKIVQYTVLESAGVANWTTAGKADTGHAAQYGAFIGYNAQWDDIVVGLEATYHHTNLSASSSGSTPPVGSSFGIAVPSCTDCWQYVTTASGTGAISLTDFGTVRARAGWAIGRFLPYLTGGLALGRASYASSSAVSWTTAYVGDPSKKGTDPGPGSGSASDGKTNALIYGWTAGLGMDVELTKNIFLRAEYEYIQFSQMRLNLNSGRIGAGFKF